MAVSVQNSSKVSSLPTNKYNVFIDATDSVVWLARLLTGQQKRAPPTTTAPPTQNCASAEPQTPTDRAEVVDVDDPELKVMANQLADLEWNLERIQAAPPRNLDVPQDADIVNLCCDGPSGLTYAQFPNAPDSEVAIPRAGGVERE